MTIQVSAADLLARGVMNDLTPLRPVLADNASHEESLVGNATLRKNEWEQIDAKVNDVLRERLTIVDDLRARGLVTPVSLGTTLRTTERLQEFSAAAVTMDGDTAVEEDRPSFKADSIPVPVISKGFRINWRQLEASRQRGEPLDLTGAAQAARRVRDQLQALITNGDSALGIPGLTTASGRLRVTLANDWDTANAKIIDDVKRMLQTAYANNLFGPFFLYVPKNYWAVLQDDYSTQKGDRTYLQRILAFEDVESVRPLDALPAHNVVMVQMTDDVIDMSEAQAPTTVQWEKNPMVTMFRVVTVAGPQIKSIETSSGATINGIVHLS